MEMSRGLVGFVYVCMHECFLTVGHYAGQTIDMEMSRGLVGYMYVCMHACMYLGCMCRTEYRSEAVLRLGGLYVCMHACIYVLRLYIQDRI